MPYYHRDFNTNYDVIKYLLTRKTFGGGKACRPECSMFNIMPASHRAKADT